MGLCVCRLKEVIHIKSRRKVWTTLGTHFLLQKRDISKSQDLFVSLLSCIECYCADNHVKTLVAYGMVIAPDIQIIISVSLSDLWPKLTVFWLGSRCYNHHDSSRTIHPIAEVLGCNWGHWRRMSSCSGSTTLADVEFQNNFCVPIFIYMEANHQTFKT